MKDNLIFSSLTFSFLLLVLDFLSSVNSLGSEAERRLDEVIYYNQKRVTFGQIINEDPLLYGKVQAILQQCRTDTCKRGFICGNRHFYNVSQHDHTRINWILKHSQHTAKPNKFARRDPTTISCAFLEKPVSIMVISAWIADQALNVSKLNHYQYCNMHHYNYSHLSFTRERYDHLERPNAVRLPAGWSTVEYVSELMKKYPKVDYFVKLDMDCLFSRTDVLLETILDPFEQYSFYVTQIEESRFIQSHTWIVKNDDYGKALINRWLEFRFKAYCADLAQEQGALNILIGRLMKEAHADRSSSYHCDNECVKRKSVYHHHHCVLDWYTDNNMSVSGEWSHPKIFLYPYFTSQKTWISPDDGYSAQLNAVNSRRDPDTFQPLTLHPCKKDLYVSPEELLSDYKQFCTE